MSSKALRVGGTALLCAAILRLFASGLPEKWISRLTEPEVVAFAIYMETGRNVRFSPSEETFSVDFVESPPPATQGSTQQPLPSFSEPEKVSMYDACSARADIGTLLEKQLQWDLTGGDPTVLILHTHSTESYTKSGEDYEETSAYRTLDENYNMLSIGRRVAQLLAEQGITAMQDTSFHDYPSYNGSYVDARKSIRRYLEEYPTIALVLDLHRDASGEGTRQMRTKAEVNGVPSAQLMLVMGVNPRNFEKNLAFSLKLHVQLENLYPGITRPLQFRAARYNQDLAPAAVLVEVGAAGNTHQEALTAAEALAQAILTLADGTQ